MVVVVVVVVVTLFVNEMLQLIFNISFANKKKVKLVTIVEGDLKAPFSMATTPRCRGGHYTFPGWLHFTLDTYLILLSVKQ